MKRAAKLYYFYRRNWVIIIYWILFILFLCWSVVTFTFAQEAPSCISIQSNSAAKMVVELEQCRVKTQELENVTTQVSEMTTIVNTQKEREVLFLQKEELYKSIIDLQKQQIVAAEKSIDDLQKHILFVQNSYKQLLKDAKPSFWGELFKNILFLGAGAATGAILR